MIDVEMLGYIYTHSRDPSFSRKLSHMELCWVYRDFRLVNGQSRRYLQLAGYFSAGLADCGN